MHPHTKAQLMHKRGRKKLFFNRALRILLITNGLILLAGAMMGPIYAIFVERIGGDLLDASLTAAIFAITAGIVTLFAGRIADKVKRNDLIVAGGYAMMGIGFLLYLFVNSIWFLFAIQVLIGAAEAIYAPSFDTLYSKHTTKKKSGTEWGAWEALDHISVGIGAIIGGLVATFWGFPAVFIMMAILCIASSIYIIILPRWML